MQDVFVRVAEGKTPRRLESVSAWLARVVASRSLDAIRRRRARQARELAAARRNGAFAVEPDNSLERTERKKAVEAALATLDGELRAALWLNSVERLGTRDVGRALGVSASTAKRRIRDAIARMKNALERRGFALPAVSSMSEWLSELPSPLPSEAFIGKLASLGSTTKIATPRRFSATPATLSAGAAALVTFAVVAGLAWFPGWLERERTGERNGFEADVSDELVARESGDREGGHDRHRGRTRRGGRSRARGSSSAGTGRAERSQDSGRTRSGDARSGDRDGNLPSFRVSGTATTEGAPARGVSIEAWPARTKLVELDASPTSPSTRPTGMVAAARTDSSGRFSLASLTTGRYAIVAYGAGRVGSLGPIDLRAQDPDALDLHVELSPSSPFEIAVELPGGVRVPPGSEISFIRSFSGLTAFVGMRLNAPIDDATRTAAFAFGSGPRDVDSVFARVPGFVIAELESSVEGHSSLVFRHGRRVRGHRVNTDGSPRVGEEIVAFDRMRYEHSFVGERIVYRAIDRSMTDAEGRFELASLPTERVALVARYAGEIGSSPKFVSGKDSASGPIDWIAEDATAVRGRLVDGRDPVPRVALHCVLRMDELGSNWVDPDGGLEGGLLGPYSTRVTTDADGRFEVALPSGHDGVRVAITPAFEPVLERPPFRGWHLAPEENEPEFDLASLPAPVAGRVVDAAGADVPFATTGVFKPGSSSPELNLATDQRGRFEMPSGALERLGIDAFIEARAEDGRVGRLGIAKLREAGEAQVVVQAGSTLAGIVRTADGEPAAQGLVTLRGIERRSHRDRDPEWTIEADGRFHFRGLESDETYRLRVAVPGHAIAEIAILAPRENVEVALELDAPLIVSVEAPEDCLDGRWKLEIRNAYSRDGNAIIPYLYDAQNVDAKTVRVRGLAPGEYRVRASGANRHGDPWQTFESDALRLVTAGTARVSLARAPPARIVGRVVDGSSGEAISGAEVGARRTNGHPSTHGPVRTDSGGRFVFKDVSAGDYSLRAEKEGFSGGESHGLLRVRGADDVRVEIRVFEKQRTGDGAPPTSEEASMARGRVVERVSKRGVEAAEEPEELTARIWGYVRASDGTPIENARIYVHRFRTTTERDGLYEVFVAAGRHKVARVEPNTGRRVTRRADVAEDGEARVDFTFDPSPGDRGQEITVRGVAIDQRGRAVGGARVVVRRFLDASVDPPVERRPRPKNDVKSTSAYRVETDDEGHFQWTGYSESGRVTRVRVSLHKNDSREVWRLKRYEYDLPANGSPIGLEVESTELAHLRLRIETRAGAAAANYRVMSFIEGRDASSGDGCDNEHGELFSDLVARRYHFVIATEICPDLVVSFDLRPGETIDRTLRPEEPGVVSGVMVGADGVPIAGAEIRLLDYADEWLFRGSCRPWTATTDDGGRFRVESVPPGPYEPSGRRPGGRKWIELPSVEVSPGTERRVEWTLE